MVIKASKKAASRKRMVLALDDDARQRVFERDGGICVRCRDKERGPQWCHIFSRRHLCLRWEADNALTMCGGCHLWWHGEPLLAVDWFQKNWPERYAMIMAYCQVNPKVNIKQRYLELRSESK